MEHRLGKDQLLDIMGEWNRFLRRKVQLIACGGTAMTLIGVKASTKDVDFMVPMAREHAYLTKRLKDLGYNQITGSGWQRDGENFRFDLFQNNRIHTTELLVILLRRAGILYLRNFLIFISASSIIMT